MLSRFTNIYSKIKNNEIFNKSLSSFIFQIIGSLLGYIFLLLVTRISGAEAWGVFVLCLAILNISSIFSRIGIDTAILKYISSFKQDLASSKAIYFKGLKIIFPLSIFCSCMLYYFSKDIAELFSDKVDLTSYLRIMSFGILPFSIIYLNAQTFRGLKKIAHFAYFQYVAKFMYAILFFIFLVFCFDIDLNFSVIYSFVFALFCVMIASTFSLKKLNKKSNVLHLITTKKLLSTSFPMMFSTSILLIMSWADSIIIGIFRSEFDVGVYNVAIKLAMVSSIVLTAVNSIVAPKLSSSFNNNKTLEFKKIVKDSTKIIFFTAFPIILFLFLFPEFLLSIFGEDFIIGKNALLILLVGQSVSVVSGSVGFILQMTGKEKIFQNILFLALLVNIGLNILLIPTYGILGAAIASTIGIVFWNITSVVYIYKEHQVLTFFNFK
jgi:O-antigen/teichoic acid export membrane protein